MILDTDVSNETLAHLNVGTDIADIETDRTLAGRTIRYFYPITLKVVTRAFQWPKHGRTGALAEVENPSLKWGKAYRYPNDCEFFRGIDNGCLVQTPENQIAWDLSRDDVSEIILTNQPEAVGEWSVIVENPARWDGDFRMAFTRYLAHLIAPRVTGGDQFKLGDKNYQLYHQILRTAGSNAMNESQKVYDNSSGYSRARR
jgi:hypothetical protein